MTVQLPIGSQRNHRLFQAKGRRRRRSRGGGLNYNPLLMSIASQSLFHRYTRQKRVEDKILFHGSKLRVHTRTNMLFSALKRCVTLNVELQHRDELHRLLQVLTPSSQLRLHEQAYLH